MLGIYMQRSWVILFVTAGQVAIWMIPQLFAYAFNFPIGQTEDISAPALVMHTFFSWLFMLKLGLGLWGGALVLNLSWWFMVIAQMIYILSGTCGRAWLDDALIVDCPLEHEIDEDLKSIHVYSQVGLKRPRKQVTAYSRS